MARHNGKGGGEQIGGKGGTWEGRQKLKGEGFGRLLAPE